MLFPNTWQKRIQNQTQLSLAKIFDINQYTHLTEYLMTQLTPSKTKNILDFFAMKTAHFDQYKFLIFHKSFWTMNLH